MGNVVRMEKNINQNGFFFGGGTWICRYGPRWEDLVKASLK